MCWTHFFRTFFFSFFFLGEPFSSVFFFFLRNSFFFNCASAIHPVLPPQREQRRKFDNIMKSSRAGGSATGPQDPVALPRASRGPRGHRTTTKRAGPDGPNRSIGPIKTHLARPLPDSTRTWRHAGGMPASGRTANRPYHLTVQPLTSGPARQRPASATLIYLPPSFLISPASLLAVTTRFCAR